MLEDIARAYVQTFNPRATVIWVAATTVTSLPVCVVLRAETMYQGSQSLQTTIYLLLHFLSFEDLPSIPAIRERSSLILGRPGPFLLA